MSEKRGSKSRAFPAGGAMKAGRELDSLVAEKVMGFEVRETMDGGPQIKGIGRCPDYSTWISAAWEVVEKLYSLDTSEPTILQIYGPLSDGYRVTIFWEHHDGRINEVHVVAKTATHAICVAALKAVGYKF